MIDAVLSYHLNPLTCGVAKFNHRLARELGVPCCPWPGLSASRPLVSIKPSEMEQSPERSSWWDAYDLFLHDRTLPTDSAVIQEARRVWYADEVGCPATIDGNPTRGAINVLTFGMAHKIQTARYAQLKALLDHTGQDYTVSVSTAIHEGSPWDATALVGERLRAVFGSALRVLGYLADDALARELQEASAVALFFEPALRANNTTFWAALDAGCPIVTNVDAQSPAVAQQVGHIDTLTDWSQVTAATSRSYQRWPALVGMLRAEPSCAK